MWCRAPKRCLSLSRFCFFFFSFRYTASPRHFLEISYQLPAVSCKDNSCWYDYELVNGPCSNDIGNVADTRGRHPPHIITQLHAASFLAASFRDARACVRARYDRANVVDFVQLNGAHGTPMIARTTAVNWNLGCIIETLYITGRNA